MDYSGTPESMALLKVKNNSWGLLNEDGKMIMPCVYEDLTISSFNIAAKKDGLWGLWNKQGLELTSRIYQDINWTWEYSKVIMVKKGDFWGGLDKDGNEIIPFIYEDINTGFKYDGKAWIKKDGLWGQIEWDFEKKSGNVLIPFIYDSIKGEWNDWDSFLAVKKNGFWGVVYETGREVVPCEYDDVEVCNYDRIAKVKKGDVCQTIKLR